MPRRRKRSDPSTFCLPVDQIRDGFFADESLAELPALLRKQGRVPNVSMQVSGTAAGSLSGIDEALAILRVGTDDWSALSVHAIFEGDRFERWDTVLTIDGPLEAFAHLATLCVGVLARRTCVCTNARLAIEAADSKPVIMLAERDDHYLLQAGDGYAAQSGGVTLVSSAAELSLIGGRRVSSLSYELIAACDGDSAEAARALATSLGENVEIIAPVDYDNDCVRTSVELARALDGKLWGVRVETADTMVDKSVLTQMGAFRPAGVNPQLLWNIRNALDAEGFGEVKIVASGGFDAARIRAFEDEGAPADAYAIGGELHQGRYEFTADIVKVDGKKQARAGREERPNPKLVKVG